MPKIVIEIPDDDYQRWENDGDISKYIVEEALSNGVPLEKVLEDIKEEIYQRSCRNYGSGFGHGLNVALEIIDRHAEIAERSEDNPKTLLENIAEWDKAIEKNGYVR